MRLGDLFHCTWSLDTIGISEFGGQVNALSFLQHSLGQQCGRELPCCHQETLVPLGRSTWFYNGVSTFFFSQYISK